MAELGQKFYVGPYNIGKDEDGLQDRLEQLTLRCMTMQFFNFLMQFAKTTFKSVHERNKIRLFIWDNRVHRKTNFSMEQIDPSTAL
jgi:hypothetical protein